MIEAVVVHGAVSTIKTPHDARTTGACIARTHCFESRCVDTHHSLSLARWRMCHRKPARRISPGAAITCSECGRTSAMSRRRWSAETRRRRPMRDSRVLVGNATNIWCPADSQRVSTPRARGRAERNLPANRSGRNTSSLRCGNTADQGSTIRLERIMLLG